MTKQPVLTLSINTEHWFKNGDENHPWGPIAPCDLPSMVSFKRSVNTQADSAGIDVKKLNYSWTRETDSNKWDLFVSEKNPQKRKVIFKIFENFVKSDQQLRGAYHVEYKPK